MNAAIPKAMFREQFKRTLPILVLCLGIVSVANLLLFLVQGIDERVTGGSVSPDEGSAVAIAVLAWVYVLGILMLLYRDGDASDVKLDMPAYLLRLPIRTFDLILWRMGYGLLFVAAIGVWSSGLHYLLFGTGMLYFLFFGTQMETTFAFWTPMLYGVTVFAFFQALAWCIGGSGFGVLLTALATIVLAGWFDFEYEPGQMSGYMSVDVLAWLAVCFLVAYAGVRIRRREGFDISGTLATLSSVFARDRGVDRRPFASPEAMRWFEWRRQGRMLPVLALCGAIAFLIIFLRWMPFDAAQGPSAMTVYSVAVAFAFYLGLGIAAVSCGGYNLFQNQRIQLGPLKAFLFIRPVSTKDLAHARISATLRSTLISLAPFAIVCAIAIFFVARSDPQEGLPAFVQGHIGLGGAAIAILLLLGYLGALWCLQWSGNIVAIGSIIAAGAGIFTVIVGVGWIILFAFPALEAALTEMETKMAPIIESKIFETIALLVITLVSALACAFLFRLAHRRDLLERKSLVMALAAFPFLVAGFSMLQNLDAIDSGQPYDLGHLTGIIPFAILAILPLATVPLVMNFARHR